MGWRIFTAEELARYNGRDGAPAYVAFEGIVYDVSNSFLWKNGNHQVLHDAGCDLTASMKDAPHGASVFEPFPRVGVLSTALPRA